MRHNPQPQEMYKHFKGNMYQVRCLAKHSETGEMLVVYQAMYGDFRIYARPLSSFMEEVNRTKYPDAKQRYRFELFDIQTKAQAAETAYSTVSKEAGVSGLEQSAAAWKTETAEPQQPAESVEPETAPAAGMPDEEYETQEELNIDPLVLQFLDADSYEKRLEILSRLHSRIDDDMINTMAVAVDIEVKEGDIEDRYTELKNCLLTFEKYECNRLR